MSLWSMSEEQGGLVTTQITSMRPFQLGEEGAAICQYNLMSQLERLEDAASTCLGDKVNNRV